MIDLVTSVLSLGVMLVATIVSPQRATCPPRWHVEGVRPSGSYVCRPNPIGDNEHDGTYRRTPDRSVQPDGELLGVVVCLLPTRPIVISDRSVRCQ